MDSVLKRNEARWWGWLHLAEGSVLINAGYKGKEGYWKKKTTWGAVSWKTPDRTNREENKGKYHFKGHPFFGNSNKLHKIFLTKRCSVLHDFLSIRTFVQKHKKRLRRLLSSGMTPCSLVEIWRLFRWRHCLHIQCSQSSPKRRKDASILHVVTAHPFTLNTLTWRLEL